MFPITQRALFVHFQLIYLYVCRPLNDKHKTIILCVLGDSAVEILIAYSSIAILDFKSSSPSSRA